MGGALEAPRGSDVLSIEDDGVVSICKHRLNHNGRIKSVGTSITSITCANAFKLLRVRSVSVCYGIIAYRVSKNSSDVLLPSSVFAIEVKGPHDEFGLYLNRNICFFWLKITENKVSDDLSLTNDRLWQILQFFQNEKGFALTNITGNL